MNRPRYSPKRIGAFCARCAALFLFAGVLPWQAAAYAQLASPLATTPTHSVTPGEVVFADLVTTDVDAAGRFYTAVFSWNIRRSDDPGYLELLHGGNVIGAIAAFEEDVEPGGARWLPSISVADVDAAAERVVEMGGQVLEPPSDFPDRGRLAVISDAEGAVMMLLRASGGDPERPASAAGTFGWAELWTRDVASAVRFYEGVFGYRALRSMDEDAPGTVVLTIDGTPHAVIVAAPGEEILPNWLPYVPVADARQTLEEIERHGGRVLVTSDSVDDNSGTFAAIVADPTGGVFAIQDWETNE